MANRKRTCYLCGEKYLYCSSCSQDRMKPAFMATFHDENCKDIFEICTNYNLKNITQEEAQKELSKCDLTNKENFKDYVQNDLKNIFEEKATKVVAKEDAIMG